MNWVLILVLLTIIGSIINGYRRGMLRIAYSLVSWIIILVVVTWSMPYFNTYIMEHTGLYGKIESRCEEIIRQTARERSIEQDVTGEPIAAGELDVTGAPQVPIVTGESAAAGDPVAAGVEKLSELGLHLPDSAVKNILAKTEIATGEFLEESGIYGELAKGLAGFVVEGISFFAALVCAWLIVHIISTILGIVSRIPIIKGLNQFLGIFAGGIYGLILVWAAFYIIALCSTSELGTLLITYINQNQFLTYLYQNNAVLTLIMWFL